MKKQLIRFVSFLLILLSNSAYAFDMGKFLDDYPTIEQIHQELIKHQFTCSELVNGYIDRVKIYNMTTTNGQAPLNAITQLNMLALSDAVEKDKELSKNTNNLPSLFCIPVLIKDNIDVRSLRTSAGSISLLGTYPIADAKLVREIRDNGGIIIAKSSMDEFAAWISGMSGLSGKIGNAYLSNYNSGGSSGGSAVSVAAGFAPLSIGTDNCGSIRIPASFNGIYGLRPTYGLVSNIGILPLGNLDGVAGPMAYSVVDLAKLLTVISGSKIEYYKNLHQDTLAKKRFAIIKSIAGKPLWNSMPQQVTDIYYQVTKNLENAGSTIIYLDLPNYNLHRKYNLAGTIENVNKYLTENISTLAKFQDICQGKTRAYGDAKHCLRFINGIKSLSSPEYTHLCPDYLKIA